MWSRVCLICLNDGLVECGENYVGIIVWFVKGRVGKVKWNI